MWLKNLWPRCCLYQQRLCRGQHPPQRRLSRELGLYPWWTRSGTVVSVETMWGAWNSALRQQQCDTHHPSCHWATWGARTPATSSREEEPPTQVAAEASGESAPPPGNRVCSPPPVGLEQISDTCVLRVPEGEEMGWGEAEKLIKGIMAETAVIW